MKQKIQIIVGILLAIVGILLDLTAAFLMWNGHILGENATSIAPIIGIVGIGLIATSGIILTATSRKSKKI